MDLKQRFKTRPLSWSQISSFEYDKEQWYSRYILGQKEPETKEMIFGKQIGKKLETDPTYLPQIPRFSKMEYPFNVVFNDIALVGYADSFCDKTKRKLGEYKTGKKEWDQKRVDSHGQIDMYCLMNFITNKIPPEKVDISLVWMPTQENGDFTISFVEPIEQNIKIFQTKRTMNNIIQFGARINNVIKEMEDYIKLSPLA